MKRLLLIAAACLLAVSLAACGKKDNNNAGQTTTDNTAGTTENGTDAGDVNGGAENESAGTDTGTGTDTETAAGDNTVESAADIADTVSSLEEVDHANVLKMGDSLYVGATLKEGTDSSQEIDEKIADKAKEAATDTDKVYVSTNPDFTKQIDDYNTKLNEGKPAAGLFDEIGDALKRMFPDAH